MLKERSKILRIIDANRNRALEATRVLEDGARLGADSQVLCQKAKRIRHSLAKALKPFEPELTAARNIEEDVGTEVSTDSEYERSGFSSIIAANASRLKESLRVVEEYGKVLDGALGKALQAIRYDCYSFEQRLFSRFFPASTIGDCLLQVIVSSADPRGLLETAKMAVEGGADVVQLREKRCMDGSLLETARRLRRLAEKHDVLFVVNDRVDIAAAVGADGVHLGLEDMPVGEARRLLGIEAIIGASAHNIGEAIKAKKQGASYIGAGALFPTGTKEDAVVRGTESFGQIAMSVDIPVFAIGGINENNIIEAIEAGVRRVAVASGVTCANDPAQAAKNIKQALEAVGKGEKKSPGV